MSIELKSNENNETPNDTINQEQNDKSNNENEKLNISNNNGINYSINTLFKNYIETPNLWYHSNPHTIILKYNLSYYEGLELYSAYVKDKYMLYSTVVTINTLFIEKLANLSLLISWVINLIGIITPLTDETISTPKLILLTGVGNIVAIIITTFIKYISIDDKIQVFKLMGNLLQRLHSEIEFMMGSINTNNTNEENNKRGKEYCLQVKKKIEDIRTITPFTISKSTIDYHYSQPYQIKSNEITVSELMNSIYCRNNNMNQFENNV